MAKITRFFQFRLSLRRRQQIGLFEDQGMTRQEWLREIFSRPWEFRNRNTDFVYLPVKQSLDESIIIGRLGRNLPVNENRPPEEGLVEYTRETWRACLLVLDPREHDDGQKLAVQYLSDVGQTHALIPRLIQSIEAQLDDMPFLISVNPITEKSAFSDFLVKNEGRVTKVRFDLEVPNMFGSEDEYDEEMEKYKRRDRAQRVKLEISNPDGINEKSERVRFTAEKAMERGTGRIVAKAAGRGNRFDSAQHRRKVDVEEVGEFMDDDPVDVALRFRDQILDRE